MKKDTKQIICIILTVILIFACCRIIYCIYTEYKENYEFCIKNGYLGLIDCNPPITFREFMENFKLDVYVDFFRCFIYLPISQNLIIMFFSPCLIILCIIIKIITSDNFFKKEIQNENNENIINEDKKIIIEKKISYPTPLKLIFGITYFILILRFLLLECNTDSPFSLLVDIIWLLPYNIYFFVLLVSYFRDLIKCIVKK